MWCYPCVGVLLMMDVVPCHEADVVTPNIPPEQMAARMDAPPEVVDVESRPA